MNMMIYIIYNVYTVLLYINFLMIYIYRYIGITYITSIV